MNFGIVREKKSGKVCNHRSVLKVVLNPILLLFGWQLVTWTDGMGKSPATWEVRMGRCKPRRNLAANLKYSWYYPMPQDRVLERKRVFF